MSNMKRICSFLLVMLLLASYIVIPAYAEDESRFELNTVNGDVGDTVQMNLIRIIILPIALTNLRARLRQLSRSCPFLFCVMLFLNIYLVKSI